MSKKHITIKELNNEGVYDTLYPNTSATQVPLSDATSQLFGQTGLNTDAALYKIIEKLRTDKKITVRVTDSNGNPVQGAKINGLLNSPTTSANGIVTGVFVSDPLTIVSPYVDIQDGTANGADYVGTINILDVVLQSVAEGAEIQYTSSTTVAFSQNVATIDVCCVGGGGGGCAVNSGGSYSMAAPGGGGGGIANSLATSIIAGNKYQVVVGSGGDHPNKPSTSYYAFAAGGSGGASKFGSLVTAPGGGGGGINKITSGQWSNYPAGGVAGSTGSGTGGNYEDVRHGEDSPADPPPPPYGNNGTANTTLSKFNEGQVFYSGGGGSGAAYGGSPNGSNGGNLNPTTPNYGGGGGGALDFWNTYDEYGQTYIQQGYYKGSKGGPGLVVIRIHLK